MIPVLLSVAALAVNADAAVKRRKSETGQNKRRKSRTNEDTGDDLDGPAQPTVVPVAASAAPPVPIAVAPATSGIAFGSAATGHHRRGADAARNHAGLDLLLTGRSEYVELMSNCF